MILKDRLKKIENNSTLLISNNKKISRDQILNRYNIDLVKISGARILICKSNISETLPIIAAIDGVEKKEFNAAHCVTRPPGVWRLSIYRGAQTNWTSR